MAEPVPADWPLLVFARAPVPGRAKTRLEPLLGSRGAAALAARLLTHTLEVVAAAACARVQLWVAGELDHPAFAPWLRRPGWTLHGQAEGDLGRRMRRAFEFALTDAGGAVLIGSDVASLTPGVLRQAAAHLQAGAQAVLGPTADGGYGLLGLRAVAPALFEALPWGGPQVAELTRARLRALGWRWTEVAEQWDVDRPEDLARLPSEWLERG